MSDYGDYYADERDAHERAKQQQKELMIELANKLLATIPPCNRQYERFRNSIVDFRNFLKCGE